MQYVLPKYILFDEAISSLDMSIQTQILDLLIHLRETRQLSYILSHMIFKLPRIYVIN